MLTILWILNIPKWEEDPLASVWVMSLIAFAIDMTTFSVGFFLGGL
jgi:hypothetical protein